MFEYPTIVVSLPPEAYGIVSYSIVSFVYATYKAHVRLMIVYNSKRNSMYMHGVTALVLSLVLVLARLLLG